MTNVGIVKNCYGCGLCATICNHDAIVIKYNEKGFLEPQLDNKKCHNCGLCVETCAFLSEKKTKKSTPLLSFGAWSNDVLIRRECSSGGIGYEIARYLISKKYNVCACRYNAETGHAEHYIASDIDDLHDSIGSKYLQSHTVDAFKKIDRKQKYLVIGTPCQIGSIRKYVRKYRVEGNFLLVDFFCHGVPSHLAWVKYQELFMSETGKINSVSWRNKETGWHDSWLLSLNGSNGTHKGWFSKSDIFYDLFLRDFCTNEACRKNCKYKYDCSNADIRIGDAWGSYYKNNTKGVSAVACFTEQGKKLILELTNTNIATFEELPFEVIAELQMRKNAGEALLAPIVWIMLKSNKKYSIKIWKILVKIEKISRLPIRLYRKVMKVSL